MQTTPSKIWTWDANFIFSDDNHYSKRASLWIVHLKNVIIDADDVYYLRLV